MDLYQNFEQVKQKLTFLLILQFWGLFSKNMNLCSICMSLLECAKKYPSFFHILSFHF
jgi:hypothetical protein